MLNKEEVLLRSISKILLALVFIALVGFTLVVNDKENQANEVIIEENIIVDKVPESDISLVDFVDKGIMKVSWYGPGFHGRKTANGEHYDQLSFTAAHKSYKFGTLLRISNPKNNKSVIVRVNDRGPYIHGRDLDLSKAAALELGMTKKGVAKLKVEEIKIAGIEESAIN